MQQVALASFPNVERWYNGLFERPAVKRGLDLGKDPARAWLMSALTCSLSRASSFANASLARP